MIEGFRFGLMADGVADQRQYPGLGASGPDVRNWRYLADLVQRPTFHTEGIRLVRESMIDARAAIGAQGAEFFVSAFGPGFPALQCT